MFYSNNQSKMLILGNFIFLSKFFYIVSIFCFNNQSNYVTLIFFYLFTLLFLRFTLSINQIKYIWVILNFFTFFYVISMFHLNFQSFKEIVKKAKTLQSVLPLFSSEAQFRSAASRKQLDKLVKGVKFYELQLNCCTDC